MLATWVPILLLITAEIKNHCGSRYCLISQHGRIWMTSKEFSTAIELFTLLGSKPMKFILTNNLFCRWFYTCSSSLSNQGRVYVAQNRVFGVKTLNKCFPKKIYCSCLIVLSVKPPPRAHVVAFGFSVGACRDRLCRFHKL